MRINGGMAQLLPADRDTDVVVCDWLGDADAGKWRNLAKHPIADVVAPEALRDWLAARGRSVELVVHMGAVSSTTDPDADKVVQTNFGVSRDLFRWCAENGRRFIYASSSSVYGIKEGVNVTEDLSLEPLTDYSKYKALCEEVLAEEREPGFTTLILRPATVCGYSPRQRLDVIVNILCNHAVNTGKIKVFGGGQLRPNIHVEDMTDLYCSTLQYEDAQIDGKTYNAGFENHSVLELAEMVKRVVGHNTVELDMVPTDDNRSYHVSSEKIALTTSSISCAPGEKRLHSSS